ncbi:MAG: hypothetical protein JJ979_25730, partial [Roseibium sp.]|nr:hypothetical protein [Roseibium sp.]
MTAIDPEYWVDYEGLDHIVSRGVNGQQINLKECPFCGDRRHRFYMNAETGVGNCFVCGKGYSLWETMTEV